MAVQNPDDFNISLQSIPPIPVCCRFYAQSTHIVNPHKFFVLPVIYENIVKQLQIPGTPYNTSQLVEDSVVVYLSLIVNNYIRGLVLNVSSDSQCLIFALDRGFQERNVSIERIFRPVKQIAEYIPPLARECELTLCVPKGDDFSEETNKTFKDLVGNEQLLINVDSKSGEKLRVTVHNSSPDDIATMLAYLDQTYLVSHPHMYFCHARQLPNYEWKYQQFKSGDILKIRIQHGNSFNSFYACTISDYKTYLNIRRDFTSYCKTQSVISPEKFNVGMSIGVKENYSSPYFERAVIIEIIDDETAKVKLIDWGKEVILNMNMIRRIKTQQFSNIPACAFHCTAPDANPVPSAMLPRVLYIGSTYNMTILEDGSEQEPSYKVKLD